MWYGTIISTPKLMDSKTARTLDGKALSQRLQTELRLQIQSLTHQIGRPPGLAVLMVGDNPASTAYVRNKEKACQRVGIASFKQHFPATISQGKVAHTIQTLNADERVDGILVQLPLPVHLDATALLNQVDPDKDVDGLHPVNLGRLVRGEPGLRSCTPAGVMCLLENYQIDCLGKQAVVIGRSALVGKPLALMLLEANATVTIAHSHSQDLGTIAQSADILVVAVGRPELITADQVKPGAVVVDVGINRVRSHEGNTRLVGDVAFESVRQVAQFLTPVPGGVGPMTVTLLLQNTVWSYLRATGA